MLLGFEGLLESIRRILMKTMCFITPTTPASYEEGASDYRNNQRIIALHREGVHTVSEFGVISDRRESCKNH